MSAAAIATTKSDTELLREARAAWRQHEQADSQVQRLSAFSHPTAQMREDKWQWQQRKTAARAVLVRILGSRG